MKSKDVAIAEPCKVDWRSMTPAEGGRFCGDCKKVVRNLSQLREREARALLAQAGNGDLCVRYLYDAKGRIFFAGERPLVSTSLLNRAKRAAATLALPLGLAACGSPSGASTSSDTSSSLVDNPELYENMGAAEPYPYEPVDAGADAEADANVDADVDADVDASPPDASPDEDAGAHTFAPK